MTHSVPFCQRVLEERVAHLTLVPGWVLSPSPGGPACRPAWRAPIYPPPTPHWLHGPAGPQPVTAARRRPAAPRRPSPLCLRATYAYRLRGELSLGLCCVEASDCQPRQDGATAPPNRCDDAEQTYPLKKWYKTKNKLKIKNQGSQQKKIQRKALKLREGIAGCGVRERGVDAGCGAGRAAGGRKGNLVATLWARGARGWAGRPPLLTLMPVALRNEFHPERPPPRPDGDG